MTIVLFLGKTDKKSSPSQSFLQTILCINDLQSDDDFIFCLVPAIKR